MEAVEIKLWRRSTGDRYYLGSNYSMTYRYAGTLQYFMAYNVIKLPFAHPLS